MYSRLRLIGLSLENWSAKILVRGTKIFRENWSSPENFGPTMDQFSMEFWSGGTIFFRENWSGGPIFSGKTGPGGPYFSGNFGPGTNFP